MKPISVGVLFCLFVCSAFAAEEPAPPPPPPPTPTGWTVPLEQLGFNGALEQVPASKNWTTKQVSSNNKGGTPIEGEDFVLADINGPGVMTRLWTRNPTGTIYIFVDDVEHPVITSGFKDFFKGSHKVRTPGFDLIEEPFVGKSSGGYYSYVPIPFEKRLRIAVQTTEPTLTYQVTYAELPKETVVQSFSLSLTPNDVAFFQRWKDSWESIALRWPSKDEHMHKSRHDYFPNTGATAVTLAGPATITEIELSMESVDPEILAGTWVSVTFDGATEPAVLAPIGAFFGTDNQDNGDHSSAVVGRVYGRMWCRSPMSFHKEAKIRFINKTKEIADIAYWVTWREGVEPDAAAGEPAQKLAESR